ncbi:unnamed protein product [Paramecium primaurelia]|uniref:Transmembrane protein n=1 Tax=Paramecium primaurelia TaxID=5886 RepID=A0A8S1MZX1_PARPR|nr:unnamed protein product [Paramecium primaurelia]
MNKFTLTFYHKDLEMQYQTTRIFMRKRILYTILFSYLIMNTMSYVQNIIEKSNEFLIQLELLLSCFLVLLYLIYCYMDNNFSYYFCVLNVVGCMMQFQLLNYQSGQKIFIFGANLMASQMILLQRSDFILSVIQIFIIAFTRITLLILLEEIDYLTIFTTISISIFLAFVQFRSDKNRRQQFLLTLKNNHWDEYLPSMIGKPFFYFEYDHTQFLIKKIHRQKDIPIYKDELCEGCNLRNLLREYSYQNQTLESYILKRAKSRVPLIQGFEMSCQNKKKGILFIEYTEIFSDAHIYIITIIQQSKNSNKVLIKQKQAFQVYLFKYIKNLMKIFNHRNSFTKIVNLNINYICLLYQQDQTIKRYIPKSILLKIIKLINNKSRQCNIQIICDQDIEIQGYKYKFISFWLQIVNLAIQINRREQIQIIIVKIDCYIEFVICLSQMAKQSLIFWISQNKFMQNLQNELFWDVDINNLRLKMFQDLDISYIQYLKC